MLLKDFRNLTDCPICNNTSKPHKCRVNLVYDESKYDHGIIYCKSDISLSDGWVLLEPCKTTTLNRWAKEINPNRKTSYRSASYQEVQEKKRQQEEQRRLELREKIKSSLSEENRNIETNKILLSLSLSQEHKKILLDRGLSEEQIIKNGYRSVVKYQKLTIKVNPKLAGVDDSGFKLNNSVGGILCPIINENGNYVGLKVNNLTDPDKGKYQWVTSSHKGIDNRIPVGELTEENPIAVHYPDGLAPGHRKPKIGICEGAEYKSAIAANRLGYPVIGVSGNIFHSSPTLLQKAIAKINPDAQIILIPDAGANPNTANQYKRALEYFGYYKYDENGKLLPDKPIFKEVKILWWEQYRKSDGDIDETKKTHFKYLTPKQWEKYLNAFCGKEFRRWLKNREFTPDFAMEQKYFSANPPEPGTITIVKSPLGSGKTTALKGWLEFWGAEVGAFSLGYRNSLLFQFCKATNFLHISDREVYENQILQQSRAKVALCVDSLFKLLPDMFEGKIIIIDELMSIIDHLIKSKTINSRDRKSLINRFEQAIKRADRVICLDANMSDFVCEYIASLSPEKKVIKIENKGIEYGRKLYLHKGSLTKKGKLNTRDKSGIIKRTVEAKRPVIATDNQKFGETMDRYLSDRGYENVRIDSTTSEQPWAKHFLQDPDNFFRGNGVLPKPNGDLIDGRYINSLIISPSAESGLSVDIKDFFDFKAMVMTGVVSVNTVLQMSRRVRDPLPEEHLWITNKPRRKNRKTLLDKSLDSTKGYAKLIEEEGGIGESTIIQEAFARAEYERAQMENPTEPFYKLLNNLSFMENFEAENYEICIRCAFNEIGYEVIDFTAHQDNKVNESFKETKEKIQREFALQIYNAPKLSPEEINSPKLKENPKARFSLEKDFLLSQFPEIDLTEAWNPQSIYQIHYKHPEFLRTCNNLFLFKYPSLIQALEDKENRFIVSLLLQHEQLSLYQSNKNNEIVKALHQLPLNEIINSPKDKEWYWKDPLLIEVIRKLRRTPTLRDALDIETITKSNMYAIRETNRALKHIGYQFKQKFRWDAERQTKIRYYALINLNEQIINEYPLFFDAIAKKWQSWAENYYDRLYKELVLNPSERDTLDRIKHLLDLHSLSLLADCIHDINLGKYEDINSIESDHNFLVTRGRIEFLTRKLTRKTFKQGIKVSQDDKNVRAWLLESPKEAFDELMNWVRHGSNIFNEQLECFSTCIQYEVLSLLKRWLPE